MAGCWMDGWVDGVDWYDVSILNLDLSFSLFVVCVSQQASISCLVGQEVGVEFKFL